MEGWRWLLGLKVRYHISTALIVFINIIGLFQSFTYLGKLFPVNSDGILEVY